MSGWEAFFTAQVGASAALAGLVFVGVSISLAEILKYPHLPGRVLESMAVLVGVLIVSSLALVPQPIRALGAELLLVGLIDWIMELVEQVRRRRLIPEKYRSQIGVGLWMQLALGQTATLPFAIAGVLLLAEATGAGLGLVVAGTLCSYLTALFNAWVILVEVHR